jgi:hypothetical protein
MVTSLIEKTELTLLEQITRRENFRNLNRVKPLKMQDKNLSKLGKIAHFSTLPYETCAQNCKYCYAIKSIKMYTSVRDCYTYQTNSLDYGARLPEVPKKRQTVRMYVSGDYQSVYVISEWIRLARENKNVMFYGYTKQWINKDFLPMLNILRLMPNVILRGSVDKDTGYNLPSGWVEAGILENDKPKQGKYFVCKSTSKNGLKCDKCKVCFSVKHKNVPIYFPAH